MKNHEDMTYYEMLGVRPNASAAEIREAYHQIARVYHPDSNYFDEIINDQPSQDSSVLFQQITSAYNTLIDAKKRSEYDAVLPQGLPSWDQSVQVDSTKREADVSGMSSRKAASRVVERVFGVGLRPTMAKVPPQEDKKGQEANPLSKGSWQAAVVLPGVVVLVVIFLLLIKQLVSG